MKEVVDFLPPDAVAYLRFADGDTRFPIQPIPSGDFLVGSGADCDLRLGDGVLPPLHSVLRASAHDASWTRMVRGPELFINGESVRQAHLHDGDLVEIGPFRLIFRFAQEQAEILLQDLLHSEAEIARNATPPAALHAHQLVHALEREMDQLAVWERSAHDGLADLLAAVQSVAERLQSGQGLPSTRSGQDDADNRLWLDERDELQRLLQYQSERIESLGEVLEHVIRQQRIMTDVLHGLTDRLSHMTLQNSLRRRAS